MKKLIVFGFAAVMAVAANAAAFQWAATAIQMVPGDPATSSVGLTAYLVDSTKVSRADMIAALSAGDFSKMKDENYLATATTIAQGTTGISRINTTTGTASSSLETYNAYTVILDGAVGSAKNFLITKELTNVNNPGYMPPGATAPGIGNVAMSFGMQNTVAWTAAAPEPTSGLLMLVGLGALALRRRRA